MRLSIVCALAVLLLASAAVAAEPAPGKTVEVACKADPEQKYSCYLPKEYDPKKPWPILYCFSPNANGDAFVQRYRNVCEERGWIVVGSMNSKNGPWEPIKAAIDAIWADTAGRFNLSAKMRYASGFSGGARVSFAVAETFAENVSGVIAIGAGLPTGASLPRRDLAVFLMCGEGDPNKRELDPLAKKLEGKDNPVVYKNFPGGHVMPEIALMEEAVRWLDEQAAERKVQRLRESLDGATALFEDDKPVEAWLLLREALAVAKDVKEHRSDANKLLKTLERVAVVKPEAAAMKKLDKTLEWIEKNRPRLAKSASARAEAVKRLESVVNRYPGTRAASIASDRAGDLMVDPE